MPYISAREIAEKTYIENGIEIYKVKDCYVRIDIKNSLTWQYTKKGTLKESFNYSDILLSPSYPLLTSDGAIYLSNDICILYRHWTCNYWHFLFEVMDKILLMEKSGFTGQYLIGDTNFSKEFLMLAGVEENRIFSIKSEDDGKIYRIKNAYIIESFWSRSPKGIIAAKVLCSWTRQIASMLYSRHIGGIYPERLFVKRIGKRRLVDSEKLLKKYGFHTIVPEKLSVQEQISFFAGANIVLSPHGANSANCIFMHQGAILIETFGKNYINPCCLHILDDLGISYRMLVESHRVKGMRPGDYMIDELLLENTLKYI